MQIRPLLLQSILASFDLIFTLEDFLVVGSPIPAFVVLEDAFLVFAVLV